MKKLLLIEEISQDLVEFVYTQTNTCLLLLSPEAVDAFYGSAFQTHCPEDFVAAETFNSLGLINLQRARDFVSKIDSHIMRKSSIVKERDFKFGFYHVDRIKILMDSIASRIIILKGCIEKVNPSIIGYVSSPSYPIDQTLFYKESLYNFVAEIVADFFGIPTEEHDLVAGKNYRRRTVSIKKIVRKWRPSLTYNIERIKNTRYRNSTKKFRILAINPNYELKELISQAEILRNFEVWVWHGYKSLAYKTVLDTPAYVYSVNRNGRARVYGSLQGKPENFWKWTEDDESRLEKDLRKFCVVDGINWMPLFSSRIKYFLSVMVPENIRLYDLTKVLIRKISPQIVLSNAGVKNIQEGSVVKAVKDCGASFCMVQHGGGGYGLIEVPNVYVRDFEQVPESNYLVWGNGVKDFFSDYAKKYDVKLFPVGSIKINRINEHKHKFKKKRAVRVAYYIMNNFRGNQNYFPGGQHYTDTWYYRFHLKIIEIFERYGSWRFVFKVPPTFKHYGLYQKITKTIPHVNVRNHKLIKVIHEPSLYIIDSLSTAIIQASATSIPIIAYVGRHCKKVNPHALPALHKRVLCCYTENDFFSAIESVLKKGTLDYRSALNNEFIQAYGIGDRKVKPCWEKIFNSIAIKA